MLEPDIKLDSLPPMDSLPDRHRDLWRAVHVSDLVAATRQQRDALADDVPYPEACERAGSALVTTLLRIGYQWQAAHGEEVAGEEMARWATAIKSDLACPPAGVPIN